MLEEWLGCQTNFHWVEKTADMETMHKVRIVNNMKVFIYARATGLSSAN